jgi:hypothetical protein
MRINIFLFGAVFLFLLVASANATTTTTTISAGTPINITNSTSIPYDITYSLALPYFLAGLVILLTASAGFYTRKSNVAVLTGTISSMLFYLILPNTMLLGLALIFAPLLFLAMLEELHKRRAE